MSARVSCDGCDISIILLRLFRCSGATIIISYEILLFSIDFQVFSSFEAHFCNNLREELKGDGSIGQLKKKNYIMNGPLDSHKAIQKKRRHPSNVKLRSIH